MLYSPGRVEMVLVSGDTKKIPGLGVINTDRFTEKSYGDKIKLGRNSYCILKPSLRHAPEGIKRGPQIVQPFMCELIAHMADISCGDAVVEGGAGTGMLSAALLRRVGENGRLYTYELRDEFLNLAESNITSLGLRGSWRPKVGDITKDVEEGNINAFIVDIPDPWEAIDMAVEALTGGGAFVAYVPTMNQLECVYNGLEEHVFTDINCREILDREMVVTQGGVRPSFQGLGHHGYAVRGTKSVDTL